MIVDLQSKIPAKDGKGHRLLGLFISNSEMRRFDLANVKPKDNPSIETMVERIKGDKHVVVVGIDPEAIAAFPPPSAVSSPKVVDPNAFGSQEEVHAQFKQYRDDLHELRSQVSALANTKSAAEAARAELEQAVKTVTAQRDQAIAEQSTMMAALTRLTESMEKLEGQVEKLSKKSKSKDAEAAAPAAPTT